jgi:parallel beta-helix repeat protein
MMEKINNYKIIFTSILFAVILILLLFFISSLSGECGGDIVCECGDTLNKTRILNVTDNLTECSGTALIIEDENITLDCVGNNITGTSNYGINISISAINITIKNCIINGFSTGINNNANNVTIQNNTISNLTGMGVFSNNTSFVIIKDNLIYNASEDCIYFDYSYDTIFENNKLHNCTIGLHLKNLNKTTINKNTIYNNSNYGLSLETNVSDERVYHNNLYNNTNHDIFSNIARELSYDNNGNYWGNNTCPVFIAGVDSNFLNVTDTHPYNSLNAWDISNFPTRCCGDIINKNITLTHNLIGCLNGLIIGEDNVTIDCSNNLINGTGVENTIGINATNKENVIIKNCKVSYFQDGIYLKSTSNSAILGNTGTFNLHNAISVLYGQKNQIKQNTASYSTNSSFGDGILIQQSSNNTIFQNTANSNERYGVWILNNALYNNVSSNNVKYNKYGLGLGSNANYTILKDNIFENNTQNGVNVSDSKNNTFDKNVMKYNNYNGLIISLTSTGNVFSNTYSCFNNQSSGNY